MELKFVCDDATSDAQVRSNCTFMELKCVRRDSVNQRQIVLIVPLWN